MKFQITEQITSYYQYICKKKEISGPIPTLSALTESMEAGWRNKVKFTIVQRANEKSAKGLSVAVSIGYWLYVVQ